MSVAFHWHPASAERWADLAALFGARGACGGCWCMFWRLPRKDWEAGKGEKNRRALHRIVKAGGEPGILGYLGGDPVAWCAVAPRTEYVHLERSRVLKPVDDAPVWSVSCLFVKKTSRRQGLSVKMLQAAVAFAAARGATVVEGYPVEPAKGSAPDAFVWTGLASAYRQAGFREVARRSPTRPIMRRACGPALVHNPG
ncbi:MAG: GNAT family N-acetyltransferase [Candidatus Krumholzibacteria bacterium]|nr:GNAT family N-acetyltransferase [Candidatus Krumholzibacteria bacterium]